jgi:transcriptional regulator with XRE-family HTH domain
MSENERVRIRSGAIVFDASGLLRRARRLADLSQREMAVRAGTGVATVGRAECGGAVSLRMFAHLVRAAGFELVVVNALGEPLDPMRSDAVRDHGGRHYPAHLDPASTSVSRRVAGLARDRPIPRLSFNRREYRDAERRWQRRQPLDHPGPEDVIDRLDP